MVWKVYSMKTEAPLFYILPVHEQSLSFTISYYFIHLHHQIIIEASQSSPLGRQFIKTIEMKQTMGSFRYICLLYNII